MVGLAATAAVLAASYATYNAPPSIPPEPLGWRLDSAFAVTPDARKLRVLVEGRPCSGAQGITSAVEYRQDEIAISMRMPGLPNGIGVCLVYPGIFGLEVALPGPVGDRRIVSLDPPPPTHHPDATPRVEYPATATP